MYAKLKYVEGAIPGKRLKRNLTNDEVKTKKKYEEKRPPRKFNPSWKIGRPWLQFDEVKGSMTCSYCSADSAKNLVVQTPNPQSAPNPFVNGSFNMRMSAVLDHEKSITHQKSSSIHTKNSMSGTQILRTDAGRALNSLLKADRDRLIYLFRNTHAVVSNNRPLRDYVWLSKLDTAKGLSPGQTYVNEKAALKFAQCIAEVERSDLRIEINNSKFLVFLMDGSTDISGDEQEVIYLRYSIKGKVTEKFLAIGSPKSTCSDDLQKFLLDTLERNGIDKAMLIGMGSDGASNMVGCKKGLSSLLRRDINDEFVNIHCYAHRLELAFRDVLKKTRLYDKLMSLLIGLYYFYTKQYKNKSGLKRSIEIFGGILPSKVTGTRWLPHLSRGIKGLLRTFKAYESHLSTISYTNAKAEGLAKILTSKDLICFALFMQKVLDPLMRLSLKLQKPESNVCESLAWAETAVEMLEAMKSSDEVAGQDVLDSGMYQDIKLKGTATSAYQSKLVDGFISAIKDRFELDVSDDDDASVMSATILLSTKKWPTQDSDDYKEFGEKELKLVVQHFRKTLKPHLKLDDGADATEEVLAEWRTLKRLLYKRHGAKLWELSWGQLYDDEFPLMMTIVDLLLTLPPTSVQCETTFSQMKLIKTSRRTRMREATLNDLLTIKLSTTTIETFDPEKSINTWLSKSIRRRRLHYSRQAKESSEELELQGDDTEGDQVTEADEDEEKIADEEELYDTDIEAIDIIYGKDHEIDEFFDNFISEEENWKKIDEFSREE